MVDFAKEGLGEEEEQSWEWKEEFGSRDARVRGKLEVRRVREDCRESDGQIGFS